MHMKKGLLLLLALLFAQIAFAQLEAWELSTQAGNQVSNNATTNAAGINVGILQRGAGVTAAAAAGSISSSGWFNTAGVPTTLADAVANNEYYEFTLPIQSCYRADITTVQIVLRSSNTGPNTATLRSSIDGYAADLGTAPVTAASVLNTFNVNINGNTGTITFRLYGYGNAVSGSPGTGGTMRIGTSVVALDNDLIINGTAVQTSLSSITFANISSCNNNGTSSDPSDDYFTADITVNYTNPPTSGNLTLSGDVLAGGGALSVAAPFNATSTVFTGIRLKADGTPSVMTATFSTNSCAFTENNGPNVGNCSLACGVSALTFANVSQCNDNGTSSNSLDDYFTANITVNFANAPATGNLTLTGDVLAGGGALSVSAPFTSPTVFTGVRLKADGTPSVVTATFSANPTCNFTVNNGPAVFSCSSNCSFTVNCPPQPSGTFSCTNPIPAPVTTQAGFQALGGSINGTFCGMLTITSVTSSFNNCSSTSVTRTYTIFDDLPPVNGVKDANEIGFTCTLTYSYAPDMTAPTFNPIPPPPANITISCTAPLPLAPALTGTDNCGGGSVPPVIFINEFHYDNIGADVNEFVEVAGTAGINLTDYQIILYNGNGGVVYDTDPLVGVIDNEGNGFGAVSLAYPANGIQNGTPDGIALYRISTNQVIQFLSYEGPFQATDGPAMGVFSTDVGVFEAGTEAAGLSLQLTGTGKVATDFTWVGPIAQSPGTLNAGQTINPLPASNAASFMQTEVPGQCAGSRIVTRKWTLSDACNNQNTHTQVITVTDTDAPVLTPKPANITISCNDPIPPVPSVIGTDACDPAGIINGPVWINEIHYDNTGNDVNEFIEIAGRAGTNLGSGYELFLYNGSTANMGGTYLNVPLTGVIPNLSNGYGTIAFLIPGIENGPSDGIAFVKGGTVLQFLSYEGVMTAIGGPANGMVSTDIGVSETGNEAIGQSLRLFGNGTVYANFTWSGPSAANSATPDAVNQGQSFPVQPPVGLPVSFTQTSMPGTCAQSQIIKRTWSTTDACGNTAIYTQTINVSDNSGPSIVCKNISVNLDIFGIVVVTQAQLLQSVSDNCSPGNNLVVTPPGPFSFNCLHQGTTQSVVLSATDPCGNTSSCTAQVTINPFDRCTPKILISDPCVCKNNATTLADGQFGETIKIESLAGQTWSVIAVNGLYLSTSLPPPNAPTLVPIGTLFAQNPNNSGDYYFTGLHVDAIGYSITVRNDLGQTVSIGNSCEYPNPTITADLNGAFCLFSNPVTLTGTPGDANILSQGFTINGVPATVFNPGQGVGQYKIVYSVNGGVPKAFGPNDPGCIQDITVYVNVVATPTSLTCNDLVYLSLDADCTENILPDDILEGTYGCYDDYIVEIDRTLPFGNGPWEPGTVVTSDIGKTYQVRVTHLVSGNKCWGNIKVEDKLSPVLMCTNFAVPCNTTDLSANYLFNSLGISAALPTVTDCQTFTLTYNDSEIPKDCASGLTKIITRKWTTIDASGNSSTCIQTISLTRPTLADLKFPPFYDGLQAPSFGCTAAYPSPDWIESQGLQGYPYVFGKPDGCNFNWVFKDVLIPVCDGTYKINRKWTALNACATGVIKYEQLIKVEDKQGPAMTCPPNKTVSVDPFTCCGTIDLPNIIIKDECSRVNNIGGTIVTFDPSTGEQTGSYTFGGTLQDFPGNNWWNRDTMAAFGSTPCLQIGTQTVTYMAEDDCGNNTTCSFKLIVQDLIPPVAVCDQFTTVALTDNGEAVVNASTFDNGSYDNCCLEEFTVSRGAGFESTVSFNCRDVGEIIMVTFRVTDCSGNTNDCIVQAAVQDKIKPSCLPPAAVTVNCENFDPSLWVYGIAAVDDNCCLDDTKIYQGQEGLTHSVNYALFDTVCNKGTITRTFRAFDCQGQSSQCTQRVVVTYLQDYFLRFPNDVIVTVCDDSARYDGPKFFGEDCELLGISYEDEIFTVVPDACFKIERNWTVINWCTYNPNLGCIYVPNPSPNVNTNNIANLQGPTVSACGTLPPWKSTVVKISPSDPAATDYCTFWQANANCYQYKQIIKILDGKAPKLDHCPSDTSICDITVNSTGQWNDTEWWDNTIQTHNLCEGPADLAIAGRDVCSGSNIMANYLLFLDLDQDGTMETVVNSLNPPPPGIVYFGNVNTPNFGGGTPRAFDNRGLPTNQTYQFALEQHLNVTGTKKSFSVRWNTTQSPNAYSIPEFPYGTHKIKWILQDGCGNQSVCEYNFTIKDCKAPTIVCLNGLSVNIMPTGMIQLWASDFLQYTEDNCTPAAQLKIGVRKCGTGIGFPVDNNGNPITNVTFDCTELGTQCVEIWSIDAAGNADYCETYVIVQDNLNTCPTSGHINVGGRLETEMAAGVEEVTVQIAGTSTFAPPYSYFDLTDQDGVYQVMNHLSLDANFTIAPEKNDNPLNGVTTYDLVLISKHILAIESLDSPYKIIAADANKSGSITTFDIVELRKLILGIYTDLPNNNSWRFVDHGFVFPNPNNPFATTFPETISIAAALTNHMYENFMGVKIGDVNYSAVANATIQAEERTVGTALFDVQDRDVKAGETFEVTFKSAQDLKGFQFTLALDGLTAIGIVEGENVSVNNFNLLPENAMSVSIDGAQSFTVRFRAEKAGKLSQMLGVSGSITRAEAYAANDLMSRLGVAFRFDGKTISGVGFELYQNQPNPFVNKTLIGFYLPDAAEATLSVFDETGRVVYQQKGQFAKGENSISLDRALINTTGLLYYKLETATDSATKKMIQAR